MLTVFSGQFHPDLESAFSARLRELKKDLWAPVAVVVPTSRLARALKGQLAQSGLSLLNVHFHTLASFSEGTVLSQTELKKPLLSDPLFFDMLVKLILREDKPFETLAPDIAVPEGFPPTVRSTLRDLLDAGIHEGNVAMAMEEKFVGRDVDLGTLRSLLRLHQIYLRKLAALPVSSRADLLKYAIELAQESDWIAGFKEVIFYGFYDMTGNQTDFFQQVAKHHPSSFFFPYVKDHPAYVFARRFRDNFLQSVMKEEEVGESAPPVIDVKVANTSGVRDEAWWVAGEINRLMTEDKIPAARIGVVARSKERLVGTYPRVFEAAGIPFESSAMEPLGHSPVVLKIQDSLRTLSRDSKAWPAKASWSDYVGRVLPMLTADSAIPSALIRATESLTRIEMLAKRATSDEFLDTLFEAWDRMEVPYPDQTDAGVKLLHAEAARGLSFDVLFLVGVEEKVFPRALKEDPFLRDDARFALSATLGHKISQKMTALEEERLLFEILINACAKKLTLTYQRTDDDGVVVGPSSFLRSFAEARGISLKEDVIPVPRRPLEKISFMPPAYLNRAEAISGLVAGGLISKALDLAGKSDRSEGLLKNALSASERLQSFEAPGAHDGRIGEKIAKELFKDWKLSATAIETFMQCPFRYLAEKIWRLEPVERNIWEEGLAADLRGTWVHKVLENFYAAARKNGALVKPFPEELFLEHFDAVFSEAAEKESRLPPVAWRAIRINIREQLLRAARADYADCLRTGYVPTYFEARVGGKVDQVPGVEWTGSIDRIDVGPLGVRVIDYKTGKAFQDKSVTAAVSKGKKAQAPLYLELAKPLLKGAAEAKIGLEFVYLFLFEDNERKVFSSADWIENKETIIALLNQHLSSLRAGDFVIRPGDHCSFCDVKPLCRVNHGISSYRARKFHEDR